MSEDDQNLQNKASMLLDDEARYKTFSAYAEISRKWVAIMDAKAGFTAALNLGLLAFLWTGAKLSDSEGSVRWLTILATVLSLFSICSAIFVAMPRESLNQIFGVKMSWHGNYRPISYYGFVASKYGEKDFAVMEKDAAAMTMADIALEALEQHFVISHSIAKKSAFVKLAAVALFLAMICAGIALTIKIFS
jgi:hypothetical protein